jgi:hypothetical protein
MSPPRGHAPHGVVWLEFLRELGFPDSTARSRVRSGDWHRLYPGVYSVAPLALLRREGRWLAAVKACGPRAALGFRDAAALHGLRGCNRSRVDVLVPVGCDRRPRGIEVHRSRTLRPQDVVVIDHIPVTSVARTILDVCELLTPSQAERVLEQAEVLEVLDEYALREQVQHNAHRKAARTLRELLDRYEYDHGAVRNEFEAALAGALRAAGAPPAHKNRWLDPGDGGAPIQPDLMFPAQRVAVLLDGFTFHRSRQKFERDVRNDQRMLGIGWLAIHVTPRQARDETTRITTMIIEQLRLRTSIIGADGRRADAEPNSGP